MSSVSHLLLLRCSSYCQNTQTKERTTSTNKIMTPFFDLHIKWPSCIKAKAEHNRACTDSRLRVEVKGRRLSFGFDSGVKRDLGWPGGVNCFVSRWWTDHPNHLKNDRPAAAVTPPCLYRTHTHTHTMTQSTCDHPFCVFGRTPPPRRLKSPLSSIFTLWVFAIKRPTPNARSLLALILWRAVIGSGCKWNTNTVQSGALYWKSHYTLKKEYGPQHIKFHFALLESIWK